MPKEFRASYQAGIVGDRLNDGSATIADNMAGLNRLSTGANDLAVGLGDVRVQINDLATNIQGMVDAFSALKFQYSGDNLVKNVEVAAKLVQAVNEPRQPMGITYQAGRDLIGWSARCWPRCTAMWSATSIPRVPKPRPLRESGRCPQCGNDRQDQRPGQGVEGSAENPVADRKP